MPEVAIYEPQTSPRQQAKHLYWQGWYVREISQHLDVPETTVSSWKKRDGWDDAKPIDRVDAALEMRMVQLIAKPDKEGRDFKEMDLLGRQLERIARISRYQNGGNEADLNPKVHNRNAGEKRKPVKNEITEEQRNQLWDAFNKQMFEYQRGWYRAGLTQRIRNILKSRQIGATYYFAHEALLDAIDTG